MPWWGIALICLAAFCIGGLVVYIVLMLFFAKSLR